MTYYFTFVSGGSLGSLLADQLAYAGAIEEMLAASVRGKKP